MMNKLDDATIERDQARMASKRAGFDRTRSELADLVLPTQSGGFTEFYAFQGRVQTDRQLDDYAAGAVQDGVAVFEGFVIPRGSKYQRIRLADDNLMASVLVQQWLEQVEARVYAMRNDPESGFTSAVHAGGEALFAFGEQAMWVDKRYDARGRFVGLSYQAEHVGQIYVERGRNGAPFRIHKAFKLTAEQAVRAWPDDAPPEVRKLMTGPNPNPEAECEFIHIIVANERMEDGRRDAAGMPWTACYYSRRDKAVFKRGGYRTLRRIVSTFSRSPNEDYGRGPMERVLQSIRGAQTIMQDRILVEEYNAKPPMAATDDMLDQAVVDLAPWGFLYGGLNERGGRNVERLLDPVDTSGAKELHMELRMAIDKASFRDLLQITREQKTHISAVRTMEEVAEKGILLGPLARQEQEWFAPLLDVELDLLWEEGLLDDMPEQVMAYFRAGGGVDVVYDNNLSRMQMADEAAGYLRTAQQVSLIAQFDESVVPAFTREYPLDKVIPGLGEVNGIPARWRASDEEKTAGDEQAAAAAQTQQLLNAAPQIAAAAKDAAQAEAAGGW